MQNIDIDIDIDWTEKNLISIFTPLMSGKDEK